MTIYADARRILSLEERGRRYSAVRRAMREQGHDVLLMVGRDGHGARGDLRYVGGYGPLVPTPHYVAFPVDDVEPVFFANSRNRGRIAHEIGWVRETRAGWVGLDDQILSELDRFVGSGRIGVARYDHLPVPLYLKLVERFGADRISDAGALMDAVRRVKTEAEIECARSAAVIADEAFEVLKESVRPGVTDLEFFAEARKVMHARGTEYSMDLVGADGAGVFAPCGYTVKSDGFVEGEVTPTYLGVYNQLPFDFAFGQVAEERRPAMAALHVAYDAMFRAIRPGLAISELVDIGSEHLAGAGFKPAPGQFGHGLGYDTIDGFSVLASEKSTLEAGMVFVMHPILRTDAGTRVLLGATVVVRDDGAESLNKADVWWECWE